MLEEPGPEATPLVPGQDGEGGEVPGGAAAGRVHDGGLDLGEDAGEDGGGVRV